MSQSPTVLGAAHDIPDPMERVLIEVTLDELIPNKNNPRLSRNKKYSEIKSSIYNSGLDHPPHVTRKHPSDRYVIKSGGNTRLEILNELYRECLASTDISIQAKAESFYRFKVVFLPWESDNSDEDNDIEFLFSHLSENDNRSDFIFIDRALAAVKLRQYFNDEDRAIKADNHKPLSARKLAEKMTTGGWPVQNQNLSQMFFAADHLFPVIPEAFWAGLGRPSVMKLRKILENSKTFWESVATEAEGGFEDLWTMTLVPLDGVDFSLDQAEESIEEAISERLQIPLTSVRADLQAISEGVSRQGFRPQQSVSGIDGPTPKVESPIQKRKPSAPGEFEVKPSKADKSNPKLAESATEQSINSTLPAFSSLSIRTQIVERMTLDELQSEAFRLAYDIAEKAQFSELIKTPESLGYSQVNVGFSVMYPDTITADSLHSPSILIWVLLQQMSCSLVSIGVCESSAQMEPSALQHIVDQANVLNQATQVASICAKVAAIRAYSASAHLYKIICDEAAFYPLVAELEILIGRILSLSLHTESN